VKKITLTLLLSIVLLMFAFVPSAAAQEGQPPVGTCLPGFERHAIHDMPGEHEHHIGLTVDLNMNGYLCVKHLSNDLHVHTDDVVAP